MTILHTDHQLLCRVPARSASDICLPPRSMSGFTSQHTALTNCY